MCMKSSFEQTACRPLALSQKFAQNYQLEIEFGVATCESGNHRVPRGIVAIKLLPVSLAFSPYVWGTKSCFNDICALSFAAISGGILLFRQKYFY